MRASPFFDGVRQVEMTLGEHEVKVPIFYYDCNAITAAFPARLSVLREFMPDRRFVPARLAPGLGVVALTAFEYNDTDIGPYNELAIAIPLNFPHFRANLPGRALLESLRGGQIHAFVHHLPVTTEIALAGGRDLYNYPKFIAGIDFSESGNRRSCRLSEGEEHIFTLTCEKLRAGRGRELQVFSHLWHDRQPQSSEFKLNAHQFGASQRPGGATLKLGSRHPIALELRRALVSNRSITTQVMPSLEGILYGPEHLPLHLAQPMLAQTHERMER